MQSNIIGFNFVVILVDAVTHLYGNATDHI